MTGIQQRQIAAGPHIHPRSPRRVAAAFAGLLLLLSVVGSGSASAATPTLTVSGSRSGSAVIELARPTVVSHDGTADSPQIEVSGGGRLAGVVLSRIGAPAASLVAVNFNLCGTPGCQGVPFEYVVGDPVSPLPSGGGRVQLPAGRYRVTLLADGAEVTVRLALPGLARSVAVRATGPTAAAYRAIDTLAADVPQNVHSGGRTYQGEQESLVLLQSVQRPTLGAAGSNGMCLIDGKASPADAYLPGCASSQPGDRRFEARAVTVALVPEQFLTGFHTAVYLPAGPPLSIGQYYAGAVPVEDASYTQVEVPLG